MSSTKKPRDRSSYLLRSLTDSLLVLEAISRGAKERGLTELSSELRQPKNKVFRILATLELSGYVTQNSNNERYSLGPMIGFLGDVFRRRTELSEIATPILQYYCGQTKETLSLALLSGAHLIFPVSIDSPMGIKVSSRSLQLTNPESEPIGRVLLKCLNDPTQVGDTVKEFNSINGEDILTLVYPFKLEVMGTTAALELRAPNFRAVPDELKSSLKECARAIQAAFGLGENKANLTNFTSILNKVELEVLRNKN